MTKLYVRQRFFALLDSFDIVDEEGHALYTVKGEWSMLKKLICYDPSGTEVFTLKQEFSLLPTFSIYRHGNKFMEVKKELTFLKPRYSIEGPDWQIHGEFWGLSYQIVDSDDKIVVEVDKEFLRLNDHYEVRIADDENVWPALAAVLSIDAATETNN